ncbi:MAG: hypothetical protein R3275_10920 [Saprospiraceae bacterium]|nr:hypothetical protein [Saprospiraceae bacterium]
MDKERTIDIKVIWQDLASQYTDDLNWIQQLWEEIVAYYSRPDRHYHNLSHLEYLLGWYEKLRNKLTDPEAFIFAIFYHDIIYDVCRDDNEDRSADLAEKRMTQLNVPQSTIDLCRDHIMATQGHLPTSDPDTNYFIDIDISVLGEDPELFLKYSQQIRLEHSHRDDEEFWKARKVFFESYLNRDHIFATEEFRKSHEDQARRNMKKMM